MKTVEPNIPRSDPGLLQEPWPRPVRAFRPERVLKPRDWQPFVAPGGGPLDIEIGCGVGLHPLRYAREFPERTLVAIEHTHSRFARFARRVARHPVLPNLRPVQADAVAWVTHSLGEASVDRYFFLYPNPYPKRGDLNRRWHAMPFMEKVIATLKPGGTLLLATNQAFYADEWARYLRGHWGLKERSARTLTREDAPRTHFEKKYLARGETCRELVFGKDLRRDLGSN